MSIMPYRLNLLPAYPNPFNPTVNIPYIITQKADVVIEIYNVRGQKVFQNNKKNQPAGYHFLTWNATRQPSGMYIAQIKALGTYHSQKLLLIK